MQSALRLLAACTMVLALSAPAWAQMGRDQAAASAERQTGGRVLAVERVDSSRGAMWRVKVVTPRGEVRVVLIEADDRRGARSEDRRNDAPGAQPESRQDSQGRSDRRRNHRPPRGD